MNALDLVMREELKAALIEAGGDPRVKVLILTGSGKAFCVGGDIGTMEGITAPAGRDRVKSVQKIVSLMVELEKPIIAGINGHAAGAGLHIALAADIVIAADTARFRESFIALGLVPDLGGFYFLPLRVGLARAKELMFTGRTVDANEAERIGLVNKVVPPSELERETDELARTLAEGPSRSYGMIKSALNLWPMHFQAFLEMEANLQSICFATRDFEEGRRAFLEKRRPSFTGE
jgi:2-(1,2-epoxy-1,2-dihydrophenyl)acetyl-CoA isomerase